MTQAKGVPRRETSDVGAGERKAGLSGMPQPLHARVVTIGDLIGCDLSESAYGSTAAMSTIEQELPASSSMFQCVFHRVKQLVSLPRTESV